MQSLLTYWEIVQPQQSNVKMLIVNLEQRDLHKINYSLASMDLYNGGSESLFALFGFLS